MNCDDLDTVNVEGTEALDRSLRLRKRLEKLQRTAEAAERQDVSEK